MAREYEEDTGRKRETMTMKEDSRDRKEKKRGERERKGDGTTEEESEKGARWYVGAAVLESVPDREEKKESGSV